MLIYNRELRNATEKGDDKLVNSNKIKGRMKELEITQLDIAKKLRTHTNRVRNV